MKIEDLKVGRVYRDKRPRGVHRLDGSYVNVLRDKKHCRRF